MNQNQKHILVVEDADTLREVIATLLEQEGYAVTAVESAEEALEKLNSNSFHCVLSDFKLPKKNGIELLKATREISPTVPFLIMTAFGSIEIAVEAMKFGANDFITKPFEPARLSSMIADVIKHRRIIDRSAGLSERGERKFTSVDPRMEQLFAQARKVARVETSVLICGESGVGKEIVARFIHEHSARRDQPFVAVNCGAIPGELIESELFGHEAGAYTGATQTRLGLFEIAKDGTLFLDEVGELRADLQVKLLRALQEKEIRRVGGSKTLPVNPRIICATNLDISEAIESGALREDFFYRIAVMTLSVPPLRERPSDVVTLAKLFIEEACADMGREPLPLDQTSIEILERYPWPGNVRELENVIERATITAQGSIKPEDLGIELKLDLSALDDAALSLTELSQRAAERAEREAIQKVLLRTGGNKSQAAKLLGVSYKTLLAKVKAYGLAKVDELAEEPTP